MGCDHTEAEQTADIDHTCLACLREQLSRMESRHEVTCAENLRLREQIAAEASEKRRRQGIFFDVLSQRDELVSERDGLRDRLAAAERERDHARGFAVFLIDAAEKAEAQARMSRRLAEAACDSRDRLAAELEKTARDWREAHDRLAAENAALKVERDNWKERVAYDRPELVARIESAEAANAAKDAEIAKLREGLTKASHLLDGWAVSLDGGEVDEEFLRVDTLAWSARNPLNAESDAALAPKGAEAKPGYCACGSRLNANGHCPWTGCPQCPSPDCAAARDPVKPTPVHKDHPPAAAEAKEPLSSESRRTLELGLADLAAGRVAPCVVGREPPVAEAKECTGWCSDGEAFDRDCPKHGGGR